MVFSLERSAVSPVIGRWPYGGPMAARCSPDVGIDFARVFEVFCKSGARWPSDRGALRFARVLRGFRLVCRFSYVFIVFYEVFGEMLN